MKEIDFTLFLGSDKVLDYFSFFKHQLQLLKRFKSYKFLLHERIMNFDFSDIRITEKQLEIFEFKIEKEENLFCIFYFEYEKLKTFSYEEKIITSIDLFFDTIWKTTLSSFQIFRLQNRFLEDFKEFSLLGREIQINQIQQEDIVDLSQSLELKNIFSSEQNYSIFISVMKNNSYLNEKNEFEIPIIFFSGILIFLRNNGVIKKVKNTEIVSILNNDCNYKISTASFCNGTAHPTDESEKKLFNELAELYMIKY